MRDPIDRLLAEHGQIMACIGDLRRVVADLERRGESALPEAGAALRAVNHMLATDLLAHARREDEALFPALEVAFREGDTPTSVMREEHRAIHAQADLFRRTLHELNEVEHPAIVAGGERLRTLVVQGGSAGALCRTAGTVIELIDAHFAKEENVLFPMARAMLTPEALVRVERKMQELG